MLAVELLKKRQEKSWIALPETARQEFKRDLNEKLKNAGIQEVGDDVIAWRMPRCIRRKLQ
jgi:hypothetical protein